MADKTGTSRRGTGVRPREDDRTTLGWDGFAADTWDENERDLSTETEDSLRCGQRGRATIERPGRAGRRTIQARILVWFFGI